MLRVKTFFYSMQAPEEAVALTTTSCTYLWQVFLHCRFVNLLAAIFRGFDSRSPLIFVAIACVIIIGDLVLVAGLHMDAAGAAIATVLAQAVSAIFAVILLAKRKNLFTITRQDFRINNQCGRLFKIGFPLALQEFLYTAFRFLHCALCQQTGLEAIRVMARCM